LHGEWRCSQPLIYRYRVYEREHIIKAAWWEGTTPNGMRGTDYMDSGYIRSNVLYRKIINGNGSEVGDEHVCSNRAIMMYQPLLPEKGET
jgi:vancomycin resistance protein VanW